MLSLLAHGVNERKVAPVARLPMCRSKFLGDSDSPLTHGRKVILLVQSLTARNSPSPVAG
jgi:hypothetical protein